MPVVQLAALQEASVLDEDTELVVEAAVDAVTRLGMFIGDKVHPAHPAPCHTLRHITALQVYHTDFACQCPCHPDRRM